MNLNEYLSMLPRKPSKVKLLIITTLWGNGDSFPKPWFKSSILLKLTGQKYFDRRIRELKDNIGCDIETSHIDGEHSYRLVSSALANYNPRSYLTNKQKKDLFNASNFTCVVCSKLIPLGTKGLQADHKIPLSRGGSHELDNWQALCIECNVAKRRACEGCSLDCRKCSWAYPEVQGNKVIIRIPKDLMATLNENKVLDVDEIEAYVVNVLRKNLKQE